MIDSVYIVTSGEYSDYHICSVWKTETEATAAVLAYNQAHGREIGGYGCASVERYAFGDVSHRLGGFSRDGSIKWDDQSVKVHGQESSPLIEQDVYVDHWDGYTRVRITQDTPERLDKVWSEQVAMVRAAIGQGVPQAIVKERQAARLADMAANPQNYSNPSYTFTT